MGSREEYEGNIVEALNTNHYYGVVTGRKYCLHSKNYDSSTYNDYPWITVLRNGRKMGFSAACWTFEEVSSMLDGATEYDEIMSLQDLDLDKIDR